MKTNVKDTSILSYATIHKIGKKQQAVYDAIKRYPNRTDRELTHKMGLTDPNEVRPRRFELVEQGFVVSSGKRVCTYSKRLAYTWKINWWSTQ